MFCITGALRCSKMFYVTENILAVVFKVSRVFLVEICGSSSFPFLLSTSRKQLDLSSNISYLSKAMISFLNIGHRSILCEYLLLKKLLFVIFEVSLYVEAIYHFWRFYLCLNLLIESGKFQRHISLAKRSHI